VARRCPDRLRSASPHERTPGAGPGAPAAASPRPRALAFVDALESQPNVLRLPPGERHWEIFRALAAAAEARGNLVADAWLAALALERGCTWITSDRDFARFPGLDWRPPG